MMKDKGVDFLPLTKPLTIDLEDDDEYQAEVGLRGPRDPDEE